MAVTETAATSDLQQRAHRHLWMHFTRLGALKDNALPIIARADGCYVWDDHGNRYFDGLSALFCVNIGHGRVEVAQAGADQARGPAFFPPWSYPHPPRIGLSPRIPPPPPADPNPVFFPSGAGEAGGTPLKPPP